MRAPATLLKAGVATTAALLLLTACGGSDDSADPAGSSSTSSGSSAGASSSSAGASGGSSDQDVQAFCTEAQDVFGGISAGLDSAQPTDLDTALDQGVAAFAQIEPPAEISADWDTVKKAFTALRDSVAGVDLSTTTGQAAVQQALAALSTQSGAAQTDLDAWVTAHCGSS